jgi:hypothetical protein
MPPQGQQLSNEDVGTFLSMDSAAQDKFIGSLSKDEQQTLLSAIEGYQKPAAPSLSTSLPAPPKPNTAAGGFVRRAADTAKGLYHTFTDPPRDENEKLLEATGSFLPGYRMFRGFVSGEAKAGKQAYQQEKDAAKSFKSDPVSAGLKAGQGVVTAASTLDPFATGTVTDVNEMENEGRNREAIGTAAFDTLTMLIGGKSPKKLTNARSAALLTGATGGDVLKYSKVMDDLAATAKLHGKPLTVGEVTENLYKTGERLESQFNAAKWPIRGKQVMPQAILTRLDKIIADHPNWAQTADGRQMIRGINKVKLQYSKPWTIDQLNAERMDEGAGLGTFYGKDASGQMTATRSKVDTAVTKAIHDGASEIVYDEVGRANPGLDVRTLKAKQSAIIQLRSQLEGEVDKLANAQAKSKTKTLGEKITPHAYVSPHRAGVYAGGMRPDVSTLDVANSKVSRAFGTRSTRSQVSSAARRAAMALPISHMLTEHPEPKKNNGTSLPPPPEPTQ